MSIQCEIRTETGFQWFINHQFVSSVQLLKISHGSYCDQQQRQWTWTPHNSISLSLNACNDHWTMLSLFSIAKSSLCCVSVRILRTQRLKRQKKKKWQTGRTRKSHSKLNQWTIVAFLCCLSVSVENKAIIWIGSALSKLPTHPFDRFEALALNEMETRVSENYGNYVY